jgi:amino acid transporter
MVSLTIVGCLVPYNDKELLNGTGSSDANASPFVIAVKNAGISVVPSLMNVRAQRFARDFNVDC